MVNDAGSVSGKTPAWEQTPVKRERPADGDRSAEISSTKETETVSTIETTPLDTAVEKISRALENSRIEHEFIIDKELGRLIVKIKNSETKEVIRQIPSEEAIRISKNIDEMLGVLMDDRI